MTTDTTNELRTTHDVGSATANWVAVLIALPAALLAIFALIDRLDDDGGTVSGAGGSIDRPAARGTDHAPPDDDDEPPLPTRADGSGADDGSVGDDDGSVGDDDGSGCRIVVTNPFASIHEQPDTFSQEIVAVPAGTHSVIEFEVVTTPIGSERWLLIEVDGRRGWLRDSTFEVASKSAACP